MKEKTLITDKLLKIMKTLRKRLQNGEIDEIYDLTSRMRTLISEITKNAIDKNQINFNEYYTNSDDLEKVNKAFLIYIKWLKSIEKIEENFLSTDKKETQILLFEKNTPIRWNKNFDVVFISESHKFKNDLLEIYKTIEQKHIYTFNNKKITNINFGISLKFNNFLDHLLIEKSLLGNEVKFIYEKDQEKNIKLEEIVSKSISDYNTREGTVKKFQNIWNENQLNGFRKRLRGKSQYDLVNKLKGKNVLVIAPGPSLKNSIEEIKKNYQKYFILVATAQSVPALTKYNITPDFIIVSDPTDYSFVLDDVTNFGEISFIGDDSVHAAFLNKPYLDIFTVFSQKECLGLVEAFAVKRDNFEGGTVSLQACVIAEFCGAKTVTIVGQDLAIGSSSYLVASNLVEHSLKKVNDKYIIFESKNEASFTEAIEVNGWLGEKLYTKLDYAFYLEQFKKFGTQKRNMKLFNASKGGAFIDGFTHDKLTNIIKMLPTVDKNVQETENKEDFERKTKIVSKFINNKITVLNKIIHITSKITYILESNINDLNLSNLDKHEKKLIYFSKKHPEVSQFFLSQLIDFNRKLTHVETISENIELSSGFYKELLNNLLKYKKYFHQAKSQI